MSRPLFSLAQAGLLLALLGALLPGRLVAQARVAPDLPLCQAEVFIDPDKFQIKGKLSVHFQSAGNYSLDTGSLEIISVSPRPAFVKDHQVFFQAKARQKLEIVYQAYYRHASPEQRIDPDFISLSGIWSPRLVNDDFSEKPNCIYNLQATLPQGYVAVAEADETRLRHEATPGQKKTTTHVFVFNHPAYNLHLLASRDYVVKERDYQGLRLRTVFFSRHQQLSDTYLDSLQKFVDIYQKIFQGFPYRQFSVVESNDQLGYSLPTFTVLGDKVLPLPFIPHTSLGHELVHQWLGNYVYIDYARGNWAEGFTSYLSDYLYRDLEGEGAGYRHSVLSNYLAYHHFKDEEPVTAFVYNQGNVSQALGYGKGGMIFHMLRQKLGEEKFRVGLQTLVAEQAFAAASWSNLQQAFEKAAGENLADFFDYWLNGRGLAEISLSEPRLLLQQGKFRLSFEVVQKNPVALQLPLDFAFDWKNESQLVQLEAKEKQTLTFEFADKPLFVTADRDYHVARKLQPEENPPQLSFLFGRDNVLMVVAEAERPIYEPFISRMLAEGRKVVSPQMLSPQDLAENSLLVLGRQNQLWKDRFDGQAQPENQSGFYVDLQKNSYNPAEFFAFIESSSQSETAQAGHKLSHYGNYSRLAFAQGKNIFKQLAPYQRGIRLQTWQPPAIIARSWLGSLRELADEVATQRVIYIGEMHSFYEHHVVQRDLIELLHRQGKKIAIGLEMFQKPVQAALDDYIAGKTDEQTFLKETQFFSRWGYDYNLYKPVFDYARQNRIALVALNAPRELVQKVSAAGLDGLTEEEKAGLPEMNLQDGEYRHYLSDFYQKYHNGAGNSDNFEKFYQAQVLWDETMAESVAAYLEQHPDSSLVVLAGNGHIQYRFGIPERAKRRGAWPYASIVQGYHRTDLMAGIADYIINPVGLRGQGSAQLGVYLQAHEQGLQVMGLAEESVAAAAGVQKDDIISAINDETVATLDELRSRLYFLPADSSALRLQIRRGEEQIEITVTLPKKEE